MGLGLPLAVTNDVLAGTNSGWVGSAIVERILRMCLSVVPKRSFILLSISLIVVCGGSSSSIFLNSSINSCLMHSLRNAINVLCRVGSSFSVLTAALICISLTWIIFCSAVLPSKKLSLPSLGSSSFACCVAYSISGAYSS